MCYYSLFLKKCSNTKNGVDNIELSESDTIQR